MVISYRPLPKRVLKAHSRTTDNYEWIKEHWDTISKKHVGQFIAVADREIVFYTTNYNDLLEYLSEHRERADLIAVRVRASDKVLLL